MEVNLLGILRVDLQHSARAAGERGIERLEEPPHPPPGIGSGPILQALSYPSSMQNCHSCLPLRPFYSPLG